MYGQNLGVRPDAPGELIFTQILRAGSCPGCVS